MKKFLLLFTAIFLFSCSSDNDDNIEDPTTIHPIVGKWKLASERMGATENELTDVVLTECESQYTLQFTADGNVVNRHFGGEGCMTMAENISQWISTDGFVFNFAADHDQDGSVIINYSGDFNQITIKSFDGSNHYSSTYVKIP